MSNKRKPYIICIVGAAGSGKDTIANMVNELSSNRISKVVSYTTRKKRRGELNGREHYYVSIFSAKIAMLTKSMLVRTYYGDKHYWTEKGQFKANKMYVYVIDEIGVRALLAKHSDKYNILTLSVLCDKDVIISRGVSQERIMRDEQRVALLPQEIDFSISNNGTEDDLVPHVQRLVRYATSKFNGSTED